MWVWGRVWGAGVGAACWVAPLPGCGVGGPWGGLDGQRRFIAKKPERGCRARARFCCCVLEMEAADGGVRAKTCINKLMLWMLWIYGAQGDAGVLVARISPQPHPPGALARIVASTRLDLVTEAEHFAAPEAPAAEEAPPVTGGAPPARGSPAPQQQGGEEQSPSQGAGPRRLSQGAAGAAGGAPASAGARGGGGGRGALPASTPGTSASRPGAGAVAPGAEGAPSSQAAGRGRGAGGRGRGEGRQARPGVGQVVPAASRFALLGLGLSDGSSSEGGAEDRGEGC